MRPLDDLTNVSSRIWEMIEGQPSPFETKNKLRVQLGPLWKHPGPIAVMKFSLWVEGLNLKTKDKLRWHR